MDPMSYGRGLIRGCFGGGDISSNSIESVITLGEGITKKLGGGFHGGPSIMRVISAPEERKYIGSSPYD